MAGIFSRRRKSAKKGVAERTAAKTADAVLHGPSPNPMTNLILADIALRGGGRLMKNALEQAMLGMKYPDAKAKGFVKGRSLKQTIVGTALARVATSSVPGALIVGGGLLAKTLYDRTRNHHEARAEGERKIEEQARRS